VHLGFSHQYLSISCELHRHVPKIVICCLTYLQQVLSTISGKTPVSTRCVRRSDPRRARLVVIALFREPERFRGQFVPVYDELLTPDEVIETFSRVTGIKARCAGCRGPLYSYGSLWLSADECTVHLYPNPNSDADADPEAKP